MIYSFSTIEPEVVRSSEGKLLSVEVPRHVTIDNIAFVIQIVTRRADATVRVLPSDAIYAGHRGHSLRNKNAVGSNPVELSHFTFFNKVSLLEIDHSHGGHQE
jgi:hypothetical protein